MAKRTFFDILKHKLFVEIFIYFSLVLFSLYLTRNIWYVDYLGGTDYLGHLAKVHFLIDNFRNYRVVYPLWSSEWYAGYPFLQLYGPLSYYFICFVSMLVSSANLGAKISVVLTYAISAASMYWAVKTIFKDRLAAFMAAVAFLMFPFRASHIMIEGNMPAAWAIALSPLSVATYIKLTEKPTFKNVVLSAVAASIVFLVHVSFFWYLGFTMALYTVWRAAFPRKRRNRWRETIVQTKNLVGLGFFVFLFTAWWLIPFFAQSRSSHVSQVQVNLAKTFHITNPFSLITHSNISSYFALYLGLSLLLIIGIALILKEYRKNKKIVFLICLTALSLVLASAYPYLQGFPPFNLLPFSELVAPVRFMYLVMLALPILFGVAASMLKERTKKLLMPAPLSEPQKAAIIVLVPVIVFLAVWLDLKDVRSDFAYSLRIPRSYQEMASFIRKDPSYFRFQEIIKGSYKSVYTYPLFGHESIDGYHLEGSPIREAISLVNYSLARNKGVDIVAPYLEALAGKYLLLSKDSPLERKFLKTGDYRQAWQNDEYTVLKLRRKAELVKEVAPVLVVANPSNRQFLLSLQYMGDSQFAFVPGRSHQIDQYLSYDEIKDFPAIFLWGYDYISTDLEQSVFKRYVEEGGTLVICPDGSPDVKQTVFGIEINSAESRGKAGLQYDRDHSVFKNINMKKFSPALWEGKPWGYTVFGNAEPLLRVDGKVVLGVSEAGKGAIVWVGFNLPYHIVYYNNSEEAKLLGNIIKWKLKYRPNLKDIQFTKRPYGYIDLKAMTKTDRPTWLMVRESNFNGWQAYLRDRRTPILTALPALMMLRIDRNTEYEIELRYRPTFWHYLGWVVTALSLVLILLYVSVPPIRQWVRKLTVRTGGIDDKSTVKSTDDLRHKT